MTMQNLQQSISHLENQVEPWEIYPDIESFDNEELHLYYTYLQEAVAIKTQTWEN
jgi:hypothetical protein